MKKKTGVIAAVVVIGLISFFMLSHDKGNDGGTVGGGMKDEIIYCQGNDITTMDINQGIQEQMCIRDSEKCIPSRYPSPTNACRLDGRASLQAFFQARLKTC